MKRAEHLDNWLAAPADTVCAQIVAAALSDADADADADNGTAFGAPVGNTVDPLLGNITLRPHQIDAVVRVRTSIRSLGGALLADTVGLGKTYVALALVRDYSHAHIIAPATLLPMWRSAITATGTANATVHSVQALSRKPMHIAQAEGAVLVLVDEAHHLRTRNTIRYRHALQATAGRDVLLLTATPVHNNTRELRTLLSLFLGQRADALDRNTLAECVVRRTSSDAPSELVPEIREHPPLETPDNRAVLECILQLAPPLPVNDGAAASALVRLGLLRAWCSSDAALTDRIRRRQLRGEAMLHSLTSGRYPTQRELESWIVGNDSVQLGFPELLIATASGDTSALLKTLVAHLDSLQKLLQIHSRTSAADATRSSKLRAMLDDKQNPPIVAFSQFASTIRALHRALSDMSGVASLTSNGGQIASGTITRPELIANFAPKANGRPPPPAAQRIRLLLTTDLLAEGVNLQDAGIVVHLDLPWTHALQQQRVGRLARMGSQFAFVHVHTFAPPMGAEAAINLIATLERKAGLHKDWVGRDQKRSLTATTSAPDEATELRALLVEWRRLFAGHNTRSGEVTAHATLAATFASLDGWIALVACDGKRRVLSCIHSARADSVDVDTRHDSAARIVSAENSTFLHAIRSIHHAQKRPTVSEQILYTITPDKHLAEGALHDLNGWLKTRELNSLAGTTSRSTSPAQKRAFAALSSRLGELSAARRPALARVAASIEQRILSCRGAGAEHALMTWANSASHSVDDWLRSFPTESQQRLDTSANRCADAGRSYRVIALLLLKARPHEPRAVSLT